jgi:hypothetical protein
MGQPLFLFPPESFSLGARGKIANQADNLCQDIPEISVFLSVFHHHKDDLNQSSLQTT